jgi:hypothetical protein
MCFSLAVGVAQAVAGFAAAQQDYDAKANTWKQNVVNSWAAGRDEQGQILNRQLQEQDALVQKEHLISLEEAEKVSEGSVSAAYGGVSGISVDNLLADISRKSAINRSVERENWRMTAAQLDAQNKGTVTTMQNRINSVERPTSPSPAGLLLNVASAGVKYASGVQAGNPWYM